MIMAEGGRELQHEVKNVKCLEATCVQYMRAQPSSCCFLDAEGLCPHGTVPTKLLQLDELLSTCELRCQLRLTCTRPSIPFVTLIRRILDTR
jgi:hypothetical protein